MISPEQIARLEQIVADGTWFDTEFAFVSGCLPDLLEAARANYEAKLLVLIALPRLAVLHDEQVDALLSSLGIRKEEVDRAERLAESELESLRAKYRALEEAAQHHVKVQRVGTVASMGTCSCTFQQCKIADALDALNEGGE